jgi:hypothetical protein
MGTDASDAPFAEPLLARPPRQTKRWAATVQNARIVLFDRLRTLSVRRSHVYDGRPLDRRGFEIIAANRVVLWHFVLISGTEFRCPLSGCLFVLVFGNDLMTDLNHADFDYTAAAELFSMRKRLPRHQPLGYRRFAQAAQAIRFAIEDLEPSHLIGAYLEVNEKRFDSFGIRQLYDSAEYPLKRRVVLS